MHESPTNPPRACPNDYYYAAHHRYQHNLVNVEIVQTVALLDISNASQQCQSNVRGLVLTKNQIPYEYESIKSYAFENTIHL